MSTKYAQRQTTVQKNDVPSAASVLDNSSQSESLQRKAEMANAAAQRANAPRPNNTGMPDNLKSGIESLSGFSMDDVRVHYNSSKPATVQALAYAQGTDIHVAPGQEKHLPHEAWHVAQQMAGRVSPTTNINGMPVNDNAALEHEADVMGEKAIQCKNVDGKIVQMAKVNCSVGQLKKEDLRVYLENCVADPTKMKLVRKKNKEENVVVKKRANDDYYEIKCNQHDLNLIWRKLSDKYKLDSTDSVEDFLPIKVDLVYKFKGVKYRTELWFGKYNRQKPQMESDGYCVAHGTNYTMSKGTKRENKRWDSLSVMDSAWKAYDGWELKSKSTSSPYKDGHSDSELEWGSFGDGDIVSKYIAERGRFECLENLKYESNPVVIESKYQMTPNEVWGSLGDMLKYRKLIKKIQKMDGYKEEEFSEYTKPQKSIVKRNWSDLKKQKVEDCFL